MRILVISSLILTPRFFRCSTTGKKKFTNEAALKIYFDDAGKNFTDLANIDQELTEQGVRYPVYAWVEKDRFPGIMILKIFVIKRRFVLNRQTLNR